MRRTRAKQLLYRSQVEYADFSINHVRGCSHGCKYPCYAMRMSQRFGRVKNYEEWVKPKIVDNALEILEGELSKLRKQPSKEQPKFVHLCFTTDPFMYGHPAVERLTLGILEKLSASGIPASVLTKGVYPIALGNTKKYGSKNFYGITLVSLDEDFRTTWEPFAAPFQQRLDALRELHKKGLRTWVSMEPYPTPGMVVQDLFAILEQVSFADMIVFGKLNYAPPQNMDYSYFYERCTRTVMDFCATHGIDFHIKSGTPGAPQDDK